MEKPNVILINCDDMGYGDLGCYGNTVNKTACIDRLAKEGVKFTSCYAASPVCSPSRASMLTGNYPAVTGINRVLFPGEPYGLNESSYTIGNLFKDNGYRTKLVGKWHCGDQGKFLPLQFGFDEYYGLPYSNDMGIQLRKNKSINYPPLPLMEDDEVIEEQPDQRSLTERYVEQCTRFIRTNRRKPFFLYLAHMHVHLPLFSNLRFKKESQNGEFGAAMAEIDWACECILLELKKQKIYENTLIIFTSDNGSHSTHGASNFPCRGGKHFTWEGGIRIPCIMHWKGKLRKDTISDQIISQIDFMPFFSHLIGAKCPENIDGTDIYDTVFYNTPTRNEYLYFGQNFKGEEKGYLCAIRVGKWKLHKQIFTRSEGQKARYQNINELYDLENDIEEKNNVYEQEKEIVKVLEDKYEYYRSVYGDEACMKKGERTGRWGIEENPLTLTTYNENHPYIVAMYDRSDAG